jgi:predicted  nucleic acid-binding Zn-ribbon protein
MLLVSTTCRCYVKATLEQVLAKFHPRHTARYDFSRAEYHGALARMTGIVCPEHGEFTQYPAQFRKESGAGCPECGAQVRRQTRRLSRDEAIERARAVHGDTYDYSKAVYVTNKVKFEVICKHHGSFWVSPINHSYGVGQGCPTCGAAKRGYRKNPSASAQKAAASRKAQYGDQFIADAQRVHGDKYDYSEARYDGRKGLVTIICPDHGPFEQRAEHHLYRAHGCPKCGETRSRGEEAVAAFVRLFAEAQERNRTVVAPRELDVLIPSASLAIEYCGEYWHAVKSVEDERKNSYRHRDKMLACAEKGVRLLTVYESEWLGRQFAIRRLIRNALGKMRGRVAARKCSVEVIGPVEAHDFFEKYHPQGGAGWGVNYALRYSGKIVACMRFAQGANDRKAGYARDWTLTRYATRLPVTGGASKLFAAFLRDYEPEAVKSFSDNRYFTGQMYERLGFTLDADLPPDYQVYHPRLGLQHKSKWQRKHIPTRIRDLGSAETFDPSRDPRSEREMTYLLGGRRLFDCGKKRWVWARRTTL